MLCMACRDPFVKWMSDPCDTWLENPFSSYTRARPEIMTMSSSVSCECEGIQASGSTRCKPAWNCDELTSCHSVRFVFAVKVRGNSCWGFVVLTSYMLKKAIGLGVSNGTSVWDVVDGCTVVAQYSEFWYLTTVVTPSVIIATANDAMGPIGMTDDLGLAVSISGLMSREAEVQSRVRTDSLTHLEGIHCQLCWYGRSITDFENGHDSCSPER